MFPELNNIAGLSATSPPSGQTILVTECGTDGSFILHHLMSLYLKAGHNVCMLGLAQSLTHYTSVANKLSLSLNKSKEAHKFVFINALDHIGSQIVTDCSKTVPATSEEDKQTDWVQFHARKQGSSLKELYCQLEKSLDGIPEWRHKPSVILVDDISVLLSLGVPALDIVFFVQYLRQMVCQNQVCLAVLCQGSDQGDDEELEYLWKQLHFHSSLVFQIEGLQTGYCKDVHGEMNVISKDFTTINGQSTVKKYQFKVTDKSVSFFALGLSAAVIGK